MVGSSAQAEGGARSLCALTDSVGGYVCCDDWCISAHRRLLSHACAPWCVAPHVLPLLRTTAHR